MPYKYLMRALRCLKLWQFVAHMYKFFSYPNKNLFSSHINPSTWHDCLKDPESCFCAILTVRELKQGRWWLSWKKNLEAPLATLLLFLEHFTHTSILVSVCSAITCLHVCIFHFKPCETESMFSSSFCHWYGTVPRKERECAFCRPFNTLPFLRVISRLISMALVCVCFLILKGELFPLLGIEETVYIEIM